MNPQFLQTVGFVCLLLLGVSFALFLSYVIATIFEIRDEVYSIKHKLKKRSKNE